LFSLHKTESSYRLLLLDFFLFNLLLDFFYSICFWI